MPWDEMLKAHAEAQAIEAEAQSGPAAAMAAVLAELLGAMFGD